MAAMTLTEARAAVRQILDSSSVRWTDGNIDSALKSCLSALLGQYVLRGGDRLREIVALTTNGSGQSDLASYDPFEITGVALVSGAIRTPLNRVSGVARGYAVEEAKTIEVELIRKFDIPATPSNPLFYNVNADADAIVDPAMEQLVVLWAARDLSLKDKDRRSDIIEVADRYEGAVMNRVTTAKSASFGKSRTVGQRPLEWFYIPGSRTLGLCRAGSLSG
jgi:hypothetical protein